MLRRLTVSARSAGSFNASAYSSSPEQNSVACSSGPAAQSTIKGASRWRRIASSCAAAGKSVRSTSCQAGEAAAATDCSGCARPGGTGKVVRRISNSATRSARARRSAVASNFPVNVARQAAPKIDSVSSCHSHICFCCGERRNPCVVGDSIITSCRDGYWPARNPQVSESDACQGQPHRATFALLRCREDL